MTGRRFPRLGLHWPRHPWLAVAVGGVIVVLALGTDHPAKDSVAQHRATIVLAAAAGGAKAKRSTATMATPHARRRSAVRE